MNPVRLLSRLLHDRRVLGYPVLMDDADAMAVMSALSQRTRLATFTLLAKAGVEGLNAGELARQVGTPSNTMSAHLTILSAAGLVEQTRQGRIINYRAVTDRALAASDFIRDAAQITTGQRS